jgi:hypothetical protein
MLINQPMSREAWRKLVEALKQVTSEKLVPEYDDGHDSHLNKRYYR